MELRVFKGKTRFKVFVDVFGLPDHIQHPFVPWLHETSNCGYGQPQHAIWFQVLSRSRSDARARARARTHAHTHTHTNNNYHVLFDDRK